MECNICKGKATHKVEIKGARKNYKYRLANRCQKCIDKAILVYGEDNVSQTLLKK